jgi:hypothetical protein
MVREGGKRSANSPNRLVWESLCHQRAVKAGLDITPSAHVARLLLDPNKLRIRELSNCFADHVVREWRNLLESYEGRVLDPGSLSGVEEMIEDLPRAEDHFTNLFGWKDCETIRNVLRIFFFSLWLHFPFLRSAHSQVVT